MNEAHCILSINNKYLAGAKPKCAFLAKILENK